MRTEILQSIQDWLGPIRKQMDANQKAMYQQMAAASTGRGGLSVTSLQSLLGKSQPGATLDPARMQQDLQIRGLFSRIKYSNLTRGQRDALSAMARSLAEDDRLDTKTLKKIFEMIALLESVGGKRDNKPGALGNRELTVDDEMKLVSDKRAAKATQQARLDALQSSFSALA